MTYTKFSEHNDHECETWNFYIQDEGNEEFIKFLQEQLYTIDDDWTRNCYSLYGDSLTEEEVDCLVKHGNFGNLYMQPHQKLKGKFIIPEDPEDKEHFIEYLYKGGIRNYMQD